MKIEMKVKMTDEKGNVITRTIETEVPEVTEFENSETFYEVFNRFERPVMEARNQLGEKIAEAYLEEAVKASKKGAKKGDCEIEGELGRIAVNGGDAIVPEHQPKERILTEAFREISLKLCTMLSYRQAVETMNRMLHRNDDNAIRQKTYADFCIRTGNALEEKANQKAAEILTKSGFDPESGNLIGKVTSEIRKGSKKFQKPKEVRKTISKWNASHTESDEQCKEKKQILEIAEKTIYISVDEIGVRHQKEHRTSEHQKQGAFVWNTVSVVETSECTHTLTNGNMRQTFCNTLAYLLEHHLLEKRHLIFLTDGAKEIRKKIEEVFGFRPYSIILDWYHLKKRCQEYLSMSICGGKEKRNEILQKLLRILWAGNIDEAIHYLNALPDSSLRPKNKIWDLCAYFEKNRVCIPCYALRSAFHLKNSSNRVEKSNDLIVAHRQKHHGMSWSVCGSGAIAQIQVHLFNSAIAA